MTSTTTGASAKTGASGRSKASQNGHVKTKTIKLKAAPLTGLEIEGCPTDLPPTFTWDAARTQGRAQGDDPRVIGDLYRLIESVVGEVGTELIRAKLATKKVDPGYGLLMEVLNDVTSHYGTDMGESPAS